MANSHLHVAGLFAGNGGPELGMARAGHHTELLCEIEPGAVAVLRNRFPKSSGSRRRHAAETAFSRREPRRRRVSLSGPVASWSDEGAPRQNSN